MVLSSCIRGLVWWGFIAPWGGVCSLLLLVGVWGLVLSGV